MGRRRRHDPAGRPFYAAHRRDSSSPSRISRRGRAGQGRRVCPGDRLADGGAGAQRARRPSVRRRPRSRWRRSRGSAGTLPAGRAVFAGRPATKATLDGGRPGSGVCASSSAPRRFAARRSSRSTMCRGCCADRRGQPGRLGRCGASASRPIRCRPPTLNTAADGPAQGYDVVFNTGLARRRRTRLRSDTADRLLRRRRRLSRRRPQRRQLPDHGAAVVGLTAAPAPATAAAGSSTG